MRDKFGRVGEFVEPIQRYKRRDLGRVEARLAGRFLQSGMIWEKKAVFESGRIEC